MCTWLVKNTVVCLDLNHIRGKKLLYNLMGAPNSTLILIKSEKMNIRMPLTEKNKLIFTFIPHIRMPKII